MNVLLNGETRQLDENLSVAELLEQLKLAGKPAAVEVNRQIVPRARHAETILRAEDRIEIVTLVGGG